MRKIALFGGSFDPPHLGHSRIMQAVLAASLVEEVWIIPASDSRYDKKASATFDQRIEMLNLMITENEFSDQVIVKEFQKNEALRDSATIDLIKWLKVKFPEYQFSFVIGTDIISELSKWRNFEELATLISFIAVPRKGVLVETIPQYVDLLEMNSELISDEASSDIRKKIQSGASISQLVPSKVREYIEINNLYA